jgi:hypothetical protein
MGYLATVARPATLIAFTLTGLAAETAASSQGQAESDASVRLLRSTSGTRGRQEGSRYIIEDPRITFAPAQDRQIVVLFEWEGRPGLQRLEARWKDPAGRVVHVSTPVEYQATSRRFAIYWTLALAETLPSGSWSVEVFVNGAPAGLHAFEVTGGRAAPTAGPRVLTQAELFQRTTAAVATVESVGAAGEPLGQSPAVALDDERIIAPFPIIDGATQLRLRTGHRTLESSEVGEWDRRDGWAVLSFPGHGLTALKQSNTPLGVGDRCFVLDSGGDGSRVIAEAAVVGQEAPPSARPRLNSGFAAGSPVVDENGDLVGIVAGPGVDDYLGKGWLMRLIPRGTVVLPAQRLPTTLRARVGLAELAARGEFMRPMSPEQRHVTSGVLAARVQRGAAGSMPEDQRQIFSRREGQVFLFVQWNPQVKKDSVTRLEVFDWDYRSIIKGTPDKVKLRPGNLFFTT